MVKKDRTGEIVMDLATASVLACLYTPPDIDSYLYALYERAPKEDRMGLFGWKDETAAARRGMTLKEYVVGGLDKRFKERLYRMLWAMDVALMNPAINSAFRDDFRQGMVSGRNKARVGFSFHGGSQRGGYGHGIAADIVSGHHGPFKERIAASMPLWRWVDDHGPKYGIGRPYGFRDAPHVGPMDGREYLAYRGTGKTKFAAKAKKSQMALAAKARKPPKKHRRTQIARR